DRLSRLVEQLLTLGAPVKPVLAPINVHKIIGEVRALMKTELDAKHIGVRLDIDTSLPDVLGEEAQLTHVFLNLIKNAIEAMPENGMLTITTRMETDFHILRRAAACAEDETTAAGDAEGAMADSGAPAGRALGKFLRVEVADTGPGFAD